MCNLYCRHLNLHPCVSKFQSTQHTGQKKDIPSCVPNRASTLGPEFLRINGSQTPLHTRATVYYWQTSTTSFCRLANWWGVVKRATDLRLRALQSLYQYIPTMVPSRSTFIFRRLRRDAIVRTTNNNKAKKLETGIYCGGGVSEQTLHSIHVVPFIPLNPLRHGGQYIQKLISVPSISFHYILLFDWLFSKCFFY